MQLEEVAKALKELGHPTRLFIFKHLVKAGEQGLPVGELQKQLAIPASTLSHHIAALEEIIAFFRDECCVNSPEHPQEHRQEMPS